MMPSLSQLSRIGLPLVFMLLLATSAQTHKDASQDLTEDNSDPAIQEGSLVMELKEWCGSAALVGVNQVHGTLMKQQITDD